MKRLITIFFLIIYAGTALGVVINFHYCGGYLAHIAILNLGGQVGCSCNPKDMPKDCCKDKLVCITTDKHNTAQQAVILNAASFSVDLPPVIGSSNPALLADSYNADHSFYYLKRWRPQPIYLLIRVFRI